MPIPQITFQRGQGGLGRPLPGEDHISGLIVSLATPPAGFPATRLKTYFSHDELLADGWAAGAAGGVGIVEYHAREFFRIQPQGVLHLHVPDWTSAADYTAIRTLQAFADGKIRQMGIFTSDAALVTATLDTIQAECEGLAADYMPLQVLYSFDGANFDLATAADLRALSNNYVSVVIGEDGNADGAALATAQGYSISCLGAALGAVAAAQVNENIGWVKKFNVAGATELTKPVFIDGTDVNTTALSLLSTLTDKGYIFLRTFIGRGGTYFNDAPTAVAATSDYAYIENNRTIEKAVRLVYARLLDELNAPVEIDPDSGQLSAEYIEHLKALGEQALVQMANDREVSGYAVLINPAQDVLSTSEVVVTVQIVPVGVSRKLTVNIGFTTNIG